MNEDSLSLISKTVLQQFAKLSKKGKPKDSEWTVLSSVFLFKVEEPSDFKVVCLASGTKCLDGDTRRRSLPGTLLHDSHAEVLARRGLIYWILDQINSASKGEMSSFISKCPDGKYEWIKNWKIGMLSTQLPCGDATIFVKPSEIAEDECEPECKRQKLDMNRTGAKLVTREGEEEGEPRLPGPEYHRLGGLRTKPGRGERTLSLSCSDKILKWNILGLQGSLCSHLFRDKIYLDCFVIVGSTFNKASLQRAFYDRLINNHECDSKAVHVNEIYNVPCTFLYSKSEKRPGPSPDSVVWVDGGKEGQIHEALTNGHKQGWSSKKLDNPKSWSALCQRHLYRKFLKIMKCKLGVCYGEIKSTSPQNSLKKNTKFDLLKKWPIKGPSEFVIDSL